MSLDHLATFNDLDEASDHPGVDYFRAVHDAFLKAESAAEGSVDHYYRIAEHTIRLRFAGSMLVPAVTPALAHVAAEPISKPSLTICIWDSFSTDTPMPPPPWGPGDYLARGEIRGYAKGRIRAVVNLDALRLNMLDSSRNLGLFWVRNAHDLPYYETGAPLRNILNWWMSDHGLQLLHGGAVGTPRGGVLLVGEGGSGKSTTALSCLASELRYVSDDYVLVGVEPTPMVYSIYNTAKLNADHIQRFPALLPLVRNRDTMMEEKALLFLHEHFKSKILTDMPIRAVLSPLVTGQSITRITKLPAAATMNALAPSTINQLPGAEQSAFETTLKLVQRTPCYRLELGTDIERIPSVIAEFLTELEKRT